MADEIPDDRKDRLRRSITNRQREGLYGNTKVDDAQISLVLRALADHTQIMDATKYAPDEGPWPVATSVGRWMHHMADEFQPTVIDPTTGGIDVLTVTIRDFLVELGHGADEGPVTTHHAGRLASLLRQTPGALDPS